jgi:hypothetical protein
MWSLIKTIVGAAFLGVVCYLVFFVDLGGRTLAGHAQDVWQAPVMRDKVERVREGMKRHLESRLAEAGAEVGRQTAQKLTAAPDDELSTADRESLDRVLLEVTTPPQRH